MFLKIIILVAAFLLFLLSLNNRKISKKEGFIFLLAFIIVMWFLDNKIFGRFNIMINKALYNL